MARRGRSLGPCGASAYPPTILFPVPAAGVDHVQVDPGIAEINAQHGALDVETPGKTARGFGGGYLNRSLSAGYLKTTTSGAIGVPFYNPKDANADLTVFAAAKLNTPRLAFQVINDLGDLTAVIEYDNGVSTFRYTADLGAPATDTWHIVWFISRDTDYEVYLDGSTTKATVLGGNDNGTWFGDLQGSNDFTDLTIGAFIDDGAQDVYTGRLDEVFVLDEEPTEAERLHVWNGGDLLNIDEFSGTIVQKLVNGYPLDSTNVGNDSIGSMHLTPFGLTATEQGIVGINHDWSSFSGQVIRLDASNIANATIISNEYQQINDLSGNNRHVTASSSSTRPNLVTKGALYAAQFLTGVDKMVSPVFPGVGTGTLMMVAKIDDLAATNRIISGFPSGKRWFVGEEGFYQESSWVTLPGGADTNWHIWCVLADSTDSVYIDGGTPNTGTAGDGAMEQFYVGALHTAAANFTGQFCEMVLFNRILTVAERNQIGEHWDSKYGIQWTTVS